MTQKFIQGQKFVTSYNFFQPKKCHRKLAHPVPQYMGVIPLPPPEIFWGQSFSLKSETYGGIFMVPNFRDLIEDKGRLND